MPIEWSKAIQIIGDLDFNKACKIICNGLSDRMPATIARLESIPDIKSSDLQQILKYKGLTKSQVIEKLREEIFLTRDEVIKTYVEILSKVDELSPNPTLSKAQNKLSIYKNILSNENHFQTLSQFPNDWNNTDLFGRLWGYAILATSFSLQERGYKKHLVSNGFDFLQIPTPILNKYDQYEYQYIDVKGFETPVPKFSIVSLQEGAKLDDLPLLEYSKGFVDGYHSNLTPFIDTAESRKEAILIETFRKGSKGFPVFFNGKEYEYKVEDMYQSGLFEGKRYKAWEVIFQTPDEFVSFFQIPNKEKTEISFTHISLKVLFFLNIAMTIFFTVIAFVDIKDAQNYIVIPGIESIYLGFLRNTKNVFFKVLVQLLILGLFIVAFSFNHSDIQDKLSKILSFIAS